MSHPTTISRPAPTTMPQAPSVQDIGAPLHERIAVDIGEGETLSAADLLRLLDRVRQELSRQLVGSPGAFVGYDDLAVLQRAVPGPGRVIVEGRLTDLSEQRHDVEYVAVSVAPGAERGADTDPLLIRGTGRTIHVAC